VLELRGLTVRYGELVALDSIDVSVTDGERLAVLGPSGSGKSTLLRAIAGLEMPATGTISWDGHDLAGTPVHRRGVGLMFQDYALFPHRNVAGNVAFGLEMRGEPAPAVRARVTEVLELVGLAGYGSRRVTELSGGEQQRVALARALAPRPRLLLLDEPLGALDRTLRERLLVELSELFRQVGLTIVYVTHDQEEALALGDRVAVLNAGRLEAVGAPQQLWRDPPTEFVARFLGHPNIVEATVLAEARARTPWGVLPVPAGTPPGRRRLLLRGEALELDPSGPICGTVASSTFRGSRTVIVVAVDVAPPVEVHIPPAGPLVEVGQRVCIVVPREAVHVLPTDDGASLAP
jgi:thiamine transport system ATP-binding protein